MDKQEKIIDKMAELLDKLEIDEYVCKNVEKCNVSGNPSNNVCKECIKKYFYKEVESMEEENKVGKIIIFATNKRPAKIWLNGRFFGSSDDMEVLIWECYRLHERFDDLEFYVVEVDDFDDEQIADEYVFDFLKYAQELDSVEQRCIAEKNWHLLYDYHKKNEWGKDEW